MAYRVNIKSIPLRLLLIFQQCVEIFARSFTELLSNQIYTLSPNLVEIYCKMTNLCYFNQDNPTILSIPSITFTGSLLVSRKRASFVGNEMRMQTCRRTELLQMLGMTTNGSHNHVGSQVLGEDRHCLVHVFSWHLFPNGL